MFPRHIATTEIMARFQNVEHALLTGTSLMNCCGAPQY
jgi:hypothetical protein